MGMNIVGAIEIILGVALISSTAASVYIHRKDKSKEDVGDQTVAIKAAISPEELQERLTGKSFIAKDPHPLMSNPGSGLHTRRSHDDYKETMTAQLLVSQPSHAVNERLKDSPSMKV